MKIEDRLAELDRFGCTEPAWFLRDHIPRFALHYGTTYQDAYLSVLAELAALDEVRTSNFRQLIESGVARKVLEIAAKKGLAHQFGELPMVVRDNWVLRGVKDPNTGDFISYDPCVPLIISNFSRMVDDKKYGYTNGVNIVVGRPNNQGELWLDEGFEVEDYDLVSGCFKKLVSLRASGIAPHLDFLL